VNLYSLSDSLVTWCG